METECGSRTEIILLNYSILHLNNWYLVEDPTISAKEYPQIETFESSTNFCTTKSIFHHFIHNHYQSNIILFDRVIFRYSL